MKPILRKLLDKTLCDMVSRATGLTVYYNASNNTVKINKGIPFKLTTKERGRLLKLVEL